MQKALETQLELLRAKVQPELFQEASSKNGRILNKTIDESALKTYKTFTLLEDREKVAEDAHQCHYCTDFAYLSMIKCDSCKIHYCIWHQFQCGCCVPDVKLVYRWSNKELEQMLQKIVDSVKKDKA